MISADRVRRTKVSIFYKIRMFLLISLVEWFIIYNAKNNKNRLAYSEYILLRIIIKEDDKNYIDSIARKSGYTCLTEDRKGRIISWE